MRQLLLDAAKRSIRYRESIGDRSVAPPADALEQLGRLREPLPEQPSDPLKVLELLDQVGSPATVAITGGRYFGFVNGSSMPVAVASNWLTTAWGQNACLRIMSPAAAVLEDVALQWVLQILRLPPTCGGAFVTGTSMASFASLAAARHAVLEAVGWDVENDGLFGAPPITVVVGAEAHSTLIRVLGQVGFGRTRVLTVPADRQGRMRADVFPKIKSPAIVCIQAGNVNTGAFDPATRICALAHDAGAWVHVDGAFGLWAAAAPRRAHHLQGHDLADSWATDAHKWLNVPYDCGVAVVRDGEALRAAMSVGAAYLPTSEEREPLQYTPEAGRRARAIDVWAALKTLGRTGMADLVERTCQHATRMAEALAAAGHEILNEVVINQVLVAFGDDETTRRVIAGIQADGTCWCGGTVWQGRTAMRISVSSYATTAEDVERSVDAILRVAAAVVRGSSETRQHRPRQL